MLKAIKEFLQGKPFGHPLHPSLVHFPIGLFVLSLLFDLASYFFRETEWLAPAARSTLGLGLLMAFLTAVPGLVDWLDIRSDHPSKGRATTHMLLNLGAIGLYVINLLLRADPSPQPAPTPLIPLLLSFAGISLIAYSGYLGGTLVYDDGIGVGRHRRHTPTPGKTIRVSTSNARDGLIPLARLEDLQDGETLRVECDGYVMAVVKLEGEIFAFQDFCTHRYGPLSEGSFHDHQVECPWHRSRFDVRTGKVTQGPAKIDLKTFEVTVVDGEIALRA
jgi:nitrite reductase/ring-hydroxylating ferredoxin subunit/uncharacterized membrane protein